MVQMIRTNMKIKPRGWAKCRAEKARYSRRGVGRQTDAALSRRATSGLDGQSAYNIVRFMRRLVDGGQAVLCTIHQPSAVLFDAFDSLLLLAKGGRMTYFGESKSSSSLLCEMC